ncbi:unnamed protein product [Effrenium voratum]|uniref:Uncharacterized protein n=1 Tax=Effrenium voratum TaxID=2562239 RepID=A0AA36MSH4_9DINO|nr:unnamed protein product [Effrenium voratum]CAJ1421945.1 unnamed protein product [Effrenium voratum]
MEGAWEDDANNLDSFLEEEVGPGDFEGKDDDDEFGDIDWCDVEHADLKDDVVEEEAGKKGSTGEAIAEDVKAAKQKRGNRGPEAKALRQQAVQQFTTLALCFIARLAWLNEQCNSPLLQAALLSRLSEAELDLPKRLKELKELKASTQALQVPETSLTALLAALQGGPASSEVLAMLLVASCRASGAWARLALALPLPGAKDCGSLLKGAALPASALWAEVFQGKWRGVTPPDGAQGRVWVLAMGEAGDCWDVSCRYNRWSAILEARGSLHRLWTQLLPAGKEAAQLGDYAAANEADVARLRSLRRQEPLPKSKAQFRHHQVFILQSLLRQDEMVNSGAKSVGLFQGKEPIWLREDVSRLRSAVQWRREGRAVRDAERPVKSLRQSSVFSSKLFGRWQTDALPEAPKAAPVVGGPIPGINNYGNIEVKQGLAAGLVHLEDEAARSAAAKLGMDFAPAVVGFRKERGLLKPQVAGCVVWERDAAELREAAEEERERLEEIQRQQRLERLRKAWQLLVKKVLVDVYVDTRYGNPSA